MYTNQKQLYATGLFLFLIPSIVFVLANLLFFVGLPLGGWVFILSILLAVGITYRVVLPLKLKMGSWFLLGLLIVGTALIISVEFYDCSFDGQWYHQDAIMFLADGWNPIWDSAISDQMVSGLNANYVNHYPKAPWVIQATLYQLLGNIEAGKAVQIIYLLAFQLLLLDFLRNRFSLSWVNSILIVLLIGGSTISLGQALSFYVDGMLYSLLGIFLLFLLELVYFNTKSIWLFCIAFAVLANIKFTGLIYALVFLIMGGLWVIIRFKTRIKKTFIQFSVTVILGVIVVGFPTYVRNTISKGHPFFPIMGPNNEGKSISEVQYPADFFFRNRFDKFVSAHGSIPIYTSHEHSSLRKPLFNKVLILESIPYFKNHQPLTMSPFGPFEGELLVFFIPLVLIFFLQKRSLELYMLFFGILASLAIQPEFWNLRYAPQLLFVVGIILLVLIQDQRNWVRITSLIFTGLFILNSSIAIFQNWKYVSENNMALITVLEPMRNSHIKVQAGWMKSFELKLKRFEITPEYEIDSNSVFSKFNGDVFSGWKYKKEMK